MEHNLPNLLCQLQRLLTAFSFPNFGQFLHRGRGVARGEVVGTAVKFNNQEIFIKNVVMMWFSLR